MAAAASSTQERRDSSIDISQLPNDIIHHVLSYLATEEATKTSIFCKTWYNAWLTCPTFNFHDAWKYKSKFSQFMDSGTTFRRYQNQKIHVDQLNLHFQVPGSYSVAQLDQSIEISVQNGIKRLELDFRIYGEQERTWALPAILFEAKSLRELSIMSSGFKCMLVMNNRVNDKVMFRYLQKLKLCGIWLDEDLFQTVIASCPLIENLHIYCCKLLKTIRVRKLYNLKKLFICARNQDVEIEAPNLQYLRCYLEDGSFKLYKTEKLKYLELYDHLPLSISFDNFGDKFPLLEHLQLKGLKGHKSLNISSRSLKYITLGLTKDVTEVNVDAPNMVSLELNDITFFPNLSLACAPSQWIFKISTSIEYKYLDTNAFCKLKRLLANAIRAKISFMIFLPSRVCGFIEIEKIPICPVIDIEEIYWTVRISDSGTLSNLRDALFRTCHPKAITVSAWDRIRGFLLYSCLLERLNEELKEVKIEVYDVTKRQWQQQNDYTSLMEASQQRKKVRFMLEWEAASP